MRPPLLAYDLAEGSIAMIEIVMLTFSGMTALSGAMVGSVAILAERHSYYGSVDTTDGFARFVVMCCFLASLGFLIAYFVHTLR
jgi:hypothetical protein